MRCPAWGRAGTAGRAYQQSTRAVLLRVVPFNMPEAHRTRGVAMIMVNDVWISITNGQGATLVLAGPTVTINSGALVIT
jgi:hypothetical protein